MNAITSVNEVSSLFLENDTNKSIPKKNQEKIAKVPVVKEKEIIEIDPPLESDILDEDEVVEVLVVKDPEKLFVKRRLHLRWKRLTKILNVSFKKILEINLLDYTIFEYYFIDIDCQTLH